jgi:circadian clock protein KaiC
MISRSKAAKPVSLKMPTGIDGLDRITGGGLPRGRTTLVVGGPGSGKTVLALECLVHGARVSGEPGIFVAFEESRERLIANASAFGWKLDGLQPHKLFFLDARITPGTVAAGEFDLTGLLAAVGAKAAAMRARRVVFDAIDVVLSLLPSPAAQRRELYRVHEWLLAQGLTAILTAKTDLPESRAAHALGSIQFMVDCVVALGQRSVEGVSQRSLRVTKYRGSGFAENDAPFVITEKGVAVASPPFRSARLKASEERVSTGIQRLDDMLEGGYHRDAGILITGAPGTAKSTLAGAFVEAACRRKESTLLVSFDSDTGEIVRNLASVRIRLADFVRKGRLLIYAVPSGTCSSEAHYLHICELARTRGVRCLVVDPVSALAKGGNSSMALSVVERLSGWAKSEGITVLCTSLLEDAIGDHEGTSIQISTIADTWIHLSYLVNAGERNRALTIIKSRGTAHSNQVRELILQPTGITLADVYTAGGEVLMGAMRWEHENRDFAQRALAEADAVQRDSELACAEANLESQMGMLQRELTGKRQQRTALNRDHAARQFAALAQSQALAQLRGQKSPYKIKPGHP